MKHTTIATVVLALVCACDTPPEPQPKKEQPTTAKTNEAPKPTATASTAEPTKTGEPAKTAEPETPLPEPDAKLLAPEKANEKAPDKFKVKFKTTKGDFVVQATREWSPNGVDRLYNLVKIGFFNDIALFRVVDGFVVQFGIHGHPKVADAWKAANIKDEPVKEGNKKGRLVFAKAGPDTRTTQMFVNFKDNPNLDKMGFPAIAEVTEGMNVIESFYNGYGGDPSNRQDEITTKGNRWLRKEYPKLDYIKSAEIVK
jgi:peptidyl-prolyl cis-trans isomerase A (cyclophilin A)